MTFVYSIIFDLFILLLSLCKLFLGVKDSRFQLMTLLFKDGLVYFIAYVFSLAWLSCVRYAQSPLTGHVHTHRFFSNLLAVENLNAIMSVIFNVLAAIFSTVRPSLHLSPHHGVH